MSERRNDLYQKRELLREYLKSLGTVAVAFSGGVDSAYLLKAAHDVLKENVLAVTVHAQSFPARELKEAKEFCNRQGIRQVVCEFDELQIPGFEENRPNRCYLCKRELLGMVVKIAKDYRITHVAEGSNLDDEGDYRPGMQAGFELGIVSPLRPAGLVKKEIRLLSKQCGLPTWDKPSFACLSSRFAYGEAITRQKLAMVEQAELLLWKMGFSQVRVRMHGDLARIEIPEAEIEKLIASDKREQIAERFKALGFSYVTVDLQGYRTGSMNESLKGGDECTTNFQGQNC